MGRVNVRELLLEATAATKQLFRDRNVALGMDLPASLPDVVAAVRFDFGGVETARGPEPLRQRHRHPAASGADLLSPREREILLLIARGDSNKLIARELDIAETTVKIHVQHILRKLGLSSRVQAAVFATSQGLA